MFIDSHAHVTDPLLARQLGGIMEGMKESNLGVILNVGYDIENSRENVELANKFDKEDTRVLASVGIHPSSAKDWQDSYLIELEKLAGDEKVIAIGEIGLDYHYDNVIKEQQHKFFVEQLGLAHRLGLPVIIHMRDAEEDLKQILIDNMDKLKNGVLFHCFNGSGELMKWALKTIENSYFAFGGQVTYKKLTCQAERVAECPVDRILTETDCPYLTPEPLRGRCLNEPKLVKYIYERVAEMKGFTVQELEKQVEENFKRLFKC